MHRTAATHPAAQQIYRDTAQLTMATLGQYLGRERPGAASDYWPHTRVVERAIVTTTLTSALSIAKRQCPKFSWPPVIR